MRDPHRVNGAVYLVCHKNIVNRFAFRAQ